MDFLEVGTESQLVQRTVDKKKDQSTDMTVWWKKQERGLFLSLDDQNHG